MRAELLERQPARTLPRVEQGGQASAKDGVRLELPTAALVNAQGQAVTGEIQVSMTPVNVMIDDIGGFPGALKELPKVARVRRWSVKAQLNLKLLKMGKKSKP